MNFLSRPLLEWTPQGLYCSAGQFYIDPMPSRARATLPPLELAVVTHAHSDHARRGSARYLCERTGLGLLRSRLGRIEASGVPYGEKIRVGEVWVSFHSAGHILGSAQVRVEHQGEVWVASGDYKRDPDPSCEPFEVVECDTFITEATFGTQKYTWEKGQDFGRQIIEWWETNTREGFNSVVFGYSLGKAQRILAELAPHVSAVGTPGRAGPVLIHDTIAELTECYRAEGRQLALTRDLKEAASAAAASGVRLEGQIVLAPPSALEESWATGLGPYRTAFASGWMQGGGRWGGGYDHGFVMSDHADWNDLNQTIRETRARRVFVQHRNGALVRHLRKLGLEAHPVEELSAENYARLGGKTLDLFEVLK